MAQTASQLLAAQSEVIAGDLPELFSTVDTIANMVDRKATKEMLSERDMRVPLLNTTGGRPGTVDLNLGDFGRGSYAEPIVQTATWYGWRFSVELPLVAIESTTTTKQSVLNAFKNAMKNATRQASAYVDRLFHVSNATAFLSAATAVANIGGNTVYTMEFSRGVMPFRVGEYYVPYDATGVTPRDSGVARKLLSINYETRDLTFSGTVTSAAATDLIAFEGNGNVASPTGPHGLAYHNSTLTSGNLHGLSRVTYPELIPVLVNGAGGQPTFQKGLQIAHKMARRRGTDSGVPSGLMCLMNTDQQANLRAQVQQIANFNLAEGKMNADLMPKADMNGTFCGVPYKLSIHQMSDRIDYTVFSNWIKGGLRDCNWNFYEVKGQRFFTLYGASGAPAAGFTFHLWAAFDWVNQNQGENALMYSLAPASY